MSRKAGQLVNKELKGLERTKTMQHPHVSLMKEMREEMLRGIISQGGDRGCSPTGYIYTADS